MNAASSHIFTNVKQAVNWSIALSVLMILAGALAIILPPAAGIAVTLLVSWLLIFSGVAHLVFAWQTRTTKAVIWELLVGIVYTVAGIYLLMHPLLGLASLTLALAVYLTLEGILELVFSFRIRPASGWGWLLFDGIVTLVLAFMIWRTWPWSSLWVIGILVGFSMIFSGFARLMLSTGARRLVSHLP